MIVLEAATGGAILRRPTITDVAKAAGVSIAVVSYALNDRPGVSAATRARVLRVADEFGWRPSAAARSIRTGPRAVGLAVSREVGTIAREAAFLDFVVAATDAVASGGLTIALHIVESVDAIADAYREWWAERRFDIVVVSDLRVRDSRIEALRRMRAPAVVIGSCEVADGLGCVGFDEEDAARRVATYLLELGHRNIATVTGPVQMHRTLVRVGVIRRVVEDRGGFVTHQATNATGEEAAAATWNLLNAAQPPSAIVYDTDSMAVAGLDVARRVGLRIPWDLSILACNDSALCQLATPAITAIPTPMAELGTAVGGAVLAVLAGAVDVSTVVPVGGVAVRGSTGPLSR